MHWTCGGAKMSVTSGTGTFSLLSQVFLFPSSLHGFHHGGGCPGLPEPPAPGQGAGGHLRGAVLQLHAGASAVALLPADLQLDTAALPGGMSRGTEMPPLSSWATQEQKGSLNLCFPHVLAQYPAPYIPETSGISFYHHSRWKSMCVGMSLPCFFAPWEENFELGEKGEKHTAADR